MEILVDQNPLTLVDSVRSLISSTIRVLTSKFMVLSSPKLVLLTQLYENYLRLLEVTVLKELTWGRRHQRSTSMSVDEGALCSAS